VEQQGAREDVPPDGVVEADAERGMAVEGEKGHMGKYISSSVSRSVRSLWL
jgi:hypothetical protein